MKHNIKELVKLKLILGNAYDSLEKMAFVEDEKTKDKFLSLSTDDDVKNMAVIQLAHLSCKQVNDLLYQIGTVKAFCSTHLDNLTAHLKELNKIDHVQEPCKIGPQITGLSNSIKKMNKNWNKYGAAIIAKRDIPSPNTVVKWVNHWIENKTFQISNNHKQNTAPSWLVLN